MEKETLCDILHKNSCCSKYIDIPARNISSRRKTFTLGADTEQSEVSDVASRNSKTNNSQNRRAEFRAKVKLNKEQHIEVMPAHT
jgi:hypothetical protein